MLCGYMISSAPPFHCSHEECLRVSGHSSDLLRVLKQDGDSPGVSSRADNVSYFVT